MWRVATVASYKMSKSTRNKVVTSAVAFIPPHTEGNDLWPQIQNIRKVHDKSYIRWMPHINLLYPFVPNNDFGTAVEKVKEAITGVDPFSISYSDMGHFQHGAKSFTMWLKPEPVDPVVALQKRLVDAFPFCTDLSDRSEHGFVPHLSVGQWKNEKDMQKKKEEFLAHWQKLSYEVDCVYLISRVGEEPFEIRYIVKFDGSVVPVKVVQEKQSSKTVFVGNLAFSTTEDDLKAAFGEKDLNVKSVRIGKDALGKTRGFAFVEFDSEDAATTACGLKEMAVAGRYLRMDMASQ